MIVYTKLWLLLEKRGMKRTDLKKVISSATLAKLGKNEAISSTVIEKICTYLNCQPGDIMENVTQEDMEKAGQIMNEKMVEMIKMLEVATGMSTEAMMESFVKEAPALVERIKSGSTDILGIEDKIKKSQDEKPNK